ncbi:MAG: efflux RND transporter periplasmic adaptor subunit [Sulfuricurvum sp.]|nr:efflux RND transporter periplasmic adaptor subunit [Sulfuricurvum sp.]
MACCDKKKSIIVGAGILIAITLIASFMKSSPPKTVSPAALSTPKEPNHYVNGVGTLEAKEIILLAPKSTSRVETLYADEGDTVRKGELLARLELSELSGNAQESTALIEKNRSQMASQKAVIEDLKAKKELADVTLARYKSLIKGGFVTQSELDTVQASARSASALLVSAQEALKQSQHDIERSKGSLSAVNAKINDLSLRSPIEGIVISRDAEAGSTIGAGMSVFKIANPKSVWVRAYIDERQSGVLKIGQKAVVTLRSTGEQHYTGIVRRIGVVSDRITEERVVYIGLDHLPEPLHLGEQAEAQIIISHD